MKVDAHISRVSAKVREGALHRHDGGRYAEGRAFAVAYGLGKCLLNKPVGLTANLIAFSVYIFE